jgi:hypothetical protein
MRITPHRAAPNRSVIGPQIGPCDAQPFDRSVKEDEVWRILQSGSSLLAHVVVPEKSDRSPLKLMAAKVEAGVDIGPVSIKLFACQSPLVASE